MNNYSLMPRLALSTRTSPWLGLSALAQAAMLAGLDGLDVQPRWRLPLPSSRYPADRHGDVVTPVLTRWASSNGSANQLGTQSYGAASKTLVVAAEGAALVIPGNSLLEARAGNRLLPELIETVRASSLSPAPMIVALSGQRLAGGRDHLQRLSVLRRQAEEWDFGLAVDLLDPVDPNWEAEAAVARLMPRLWLIRFGTIHRRSRGRTWAAITLRTLAAAADCGFGGTIALAPELSHWASVRTRAIADAAAESADRIRQQFAPVNATLARELFPETFLRW